MSAHHIIPYHTTPYHTIPAYHTHMSTYHTLQYICAHTTLIWSRFTTPHNTSAHTLPYHGTWNFPINTWSTCDPGSSATLGHLSRLLVWSARCDKWSHQMSCCSPEALLLLAFCSGCVHRVLSWSSPRGTGSILVWNYFLPAAS